MIELLSAPTDVSLHLTHFCNLKCKHCYLRAGEKVEKELTSEEMDLVLEKLIRIKVFKILLTGGEPMLRQDFIDIIKKLYQKMWMTLSTNGTLINDDNIKEISKYVKEYLISIDGATQKSHDIFRGTNGAFNKTINAIRLINSIENNKLKIILNSTIHKQNISEIESLVDLALALKCKMIRFSALFPKGRALDNKNLFLNNDEIKNVIYRILEKKKNLDNNILSIQFDDGLQIPLILYGYEQITSQKIECGVGKTMFSIMPSGDILPCEFFQENSGFIIGNVLSDDLHKLWKESSILNKIRTNNFSSICKTCKYENKCMTMRCKALTILGNYCCNWYEHN